MTETLSSLEATEEEKRMLDALNPLPMSNEEGWAVIRREQALSVRVLRKEAEYWKEVAGVLLEALQEVDNHLGEFIHNNEGLSLTVGRAFEKAREFECGSEQSSQPPPPSE